MPRRRPPSRPRRRALACLWGGLLGVAAACGHGGGAGGACGAPVQERLDPRSTQHIFPGAPEPSYLTDPPTSGPHRPGNHPTGVLTAPIDRPRQVAMLEGGAVLVQYQGLAGADVRRLQALAAANVTVAPADRLPGPVVATAWQHKLVCRGVSLPALRAFIGAHVGRGPGRP